jgi:hypothetical protein
MNYFPDGRLPWPFLQDSQVNIFGIGDENSARSRFLTEHLFANAVDWPCLSGKEIRSEPITHGFKSYLVDLIQRF